MNSEILNRITIDPDMCFGKPTIRNSRYTVELVLDLLSAGMSNQEIVEDYPGIEEKDILACLSFATQLLKAKIVKQVA